MSSERKFWGGVAVTFIVAVAILLVFDAIHRAHGAEAGLDFWWRLTERGAKPNNPIKQDQKWVMITKLTCGEREAVVWSAEDGAEGFIHFDNTPESERKSITIENGDVYYKGKLCESHIHPSVQPPPLDIWIISRDAQGNVIPWPETKPDHMWFAVAHILRQIYGRCVGRRERRAKLHQVSWRPDGA